MFECEPLFPTRLMGGRLAIRKHDAGVRLSGATSSSSRTAAAPSPMARPPTPATAACALARSVRPNPVRPSPCTTPSHDLVTDGSLRVTAHTAGARLPGPELVPTYIVCLCVRTRAPARDRGSAGVLAVGEADWYRRACEQGVWGSVSGVGGRVGGTCGGAGGAGE